MGELLADHTTLRLGGPARHWFTHTDPTAWPDLARTVRREPGRAFTLGGGSNTLAADTGYDGTVIRMATRGITCSHTGPGTVEVTAQAGEALADLVAFTVAESLSGIEYLSGIPGTAGAAPVQNTGAYGQEIADALTRITAYDWRTGHTLDLPPAACGFGYRTSVFKARPGRFTILSLNLRLIRSALAAPVGYRHLADHLAVPLCTRPPLAEAAAAVLDHRAARGLLLPETGDDARQAGSVFLNPSVTLTQADAVRAAGGPLHHDRDNVLRTSAGWLLEHSGHHPGQELQPGIHTSKRRTLTLTARREATTTGFAAALAAMADRVHATTGIRLHPEPVRI
ncbi:UDP-N-acetylmuramate dehydrogenase [Streptomyces sp. APSN-46.1]|uniref:UDP-N-acetylmuramate dehydrogenase n=1 Tax=Streptomyces sp. APSN-46.1 TaxID=2929049 RepID=UPI001FB3D212|nr:UDP-N-acetylmuramate dehydrogenase [Streptomyces sp. APSN-46.1]MCJ1678522.1 UDP-N-acetylmuramate dehydrogenase [Streptomyces sp. APSN-46.1]